MSLLGLLEAEGEVRKPRAPCAICGAESDYDNWCGPLCGVCAGAWFSAPELDPRIIDAPNLSPEESAQRWRDATCAWAERRKASLRRSP
jgi:hypothetical protein